MKGLTMRLQIPRVMCTGKPEPHAWSKGDRSGVIYRVELSDGTGNIRVNCRDEAAYAAFAPFIMYQVDINLTQFQNGEIRVEAVNAQAVK